MEDENRVPLLKKTYFENCPGCKLDQKKDADKGIPYRLFFYVWISVLATGLPISSLFPFLYFMIQDMHIAKRVEDIGFYAGFVGAAFMFGRAVTSVIWGMVADRWGRKPVIIIGLISLIIFNTLFGLSTNYWMAIATRFLLGALNGLVGPIKAYAAEVCRPEHQSIGMSLVSIARGVGLIVGPAIGGFLAQPAEKFPNIFSKESFFGRFPYFLPCFCISLFAAGVLIICIWLPETLHTHPENRKEDEFVEASSCKSHTREKDEEAEGRVPPSKENLLTNWPLMSSIIVYCVFSLHNKAYSEIFSLWAESDRKFGGLSFSSQDVGEVLAVSGFSLLVFQLFLYPPADKLLGTINLARVAAVISIPLLASYPFMTKLSGLALKIAVNSTSLLKNVLSATIITATSILQNNAVPQHQRGAANGISMTGMSFCKAVAPAAAGIMFSWAQRRQHASFLPGFSLLVFQIFLYPPADKLLGTINLARVAAVISIPLLASSPFMTKLSGLALKIAVNSTSLLKNVLSTTIITATSILQNNAVPQHQRGVANGISMTGMSFCKAVAPAAAGIIFSWAQRRQHASFLPGDQMVFFILNMVAFVGLLMTFKSFLVTKR